MAANRLSNLAADPGQIAGVPVAELPALIGEAEALRARLWAQLQAAATPATPAPSNGSGSADRLLTVDEAAERLGVSVRWLYRRVDSLPFVRRIGSGTLRFSEKGLQRWMEAKR